jgi:uncharacterized protein YegL
MAFLWTEPAPADPWESSLVAQAADEARAGDIVAEAIAGEEAP